MSESTNPVEQKSTDSFDLNDLVHPDSKKNKKKIKCLRCDSFILQPDSCVFTKLETSMSIPSMKQKKDLANSSAGISSDLLNDFWLVNEMYTFENVGFTNTVENKKYLICADCEIGPIGVQNIENPNLFYVSLDRVKHVD